MAISWDEMNAAVKDAEITIRQAEVRINDMARIVAGRLRLAGVSNYYLKRLKKELKNYNMHTGQWKE